MMIQISVFGRCFYGKQVVLNFLLQNSYSALDLRGKANDERSVWSYKPSRLNNAKSTKAKVQPKTSLYEGVDGHYHALGSSHFTSPGSLRSEMRETSTDIYVLVPGRIDRHGKIYSDHALPGQVPTDFEERERSAAANWLLLPATWQGFHGQTTGQEAAVHHSRRAGGGSRKQPWSRAGPAGQEVFQEGLMGPAYRLVVNNLKSHFMLLYVTCVYFRQWKETHFASYKPSSTRRIGHHHHQMDRNNKLFDFNL